MGTSSITNQFSLTITGGTNIISAVTYLYNINGQGFGAGYTTSSTTSQTPTVTITNGATGVYASPWTVVVRATNPAGLVDSVASALINYFPLPIIQYKFETGDQVGQNLYNWATGLYDASFTAANMISTARFATGSASCYFDGTNSISIKPAIVSTNANALAAGFNATGWTPKNTLGYTLTAWYYNTGASWTGSLFQFIYSSDHTVGIVPNSRLEFGASNYAPPPGWGSIALNTWMFFALVFPAGSVSTAINPTLYVYGNGGDVSYNITNQVTSEGTLGVYNYTTINLGTNAGVSYIGAGVLTGYYDDFRMYAVALNSTQIHAIINKTV